MKNSDFLKTAILISKYFKGGINFEYIINEMPLELFSEIFDICEELVKKENKAISR